MPLARRLFFPTFLAISLLAGCARTADRSAPDLGPAIDRARAATADLADRAIRLEKNLVALRGTSAEVREALWKAASEGRATMPPAAPASLLDLCNHIEGQVERIDAFILPRIDESLKDAEAIRAGAAILSGPVLDELLAAETQVGLLAARAEKAEARIEQLEREKNDAIHKLLAWFIIAGVAGVAAGVGLAIFWKPKLGAGIAAGSFILFGTASALWRWLNEIQWTMLILMGAGLIVIVVLLVLAVRRNWKSFGQAIQGGQDVKVALENLVANFKPDQIIAVLASAPKGVRGWFNAIQQKAQDKATRAMVVKTKKENGGGDSSETSDPPPAG